METEWVTGMERLDLRCCTCCCWRRFGEGRPDWREWTWKDVAPGIAVANGVTSAIRLCPIPRTLKSDSR